MGIKRKLMLNIGVFKLNASKFEILYQILGLLTILYVMSPFRFWKELLFPNHIETIAIVACFAVLFFGLLILKLIISPQAIKLKISNIDIVMLVAVLYTFCHFIFQYKARSQEFVFESILLIFLYTFFRFGCIKNEFLLLLVFPLTGIAQLYYGIYKQTYFFTPGYGLQNISGIFHNKALLGGFIGIAATITFGLVIYSTKSLFLTLKRGLLIFCFFVLLVQLLASNSRAAWLGFVISNLYLICSRFGLYKKFLNLPNLKKGLILVASIFLFSSIFYSLYEYKKASADGRVLIWEVSYSMIKEKPLLGNGINAFQAKYMEYQATYFQRNPRSSFSYLAEDNHYAFNEFIRIWVEYGIIGLLLLLVLIYLTFFNKPNNIGELNKFSVIIIAKSALISLLVLSLFSYPFAAFQFKVLALLFIALISKDSQTVNLSEKGLFRSFNLVFLRYSKSFKSAFVLTWLIFSIILMFSINQYILAFEKWDNALSQFSNKNYYQCIESFESGYSKLKSNGKFLSMYGRALNVLGQYNKAITILLKANCLLSSTTNYTELGKSYKEIGDFENAKCSLVKASFMIPSKFQSKYLLSKMFFEMGKIDDAQNIAQELLSKDVKVWSPELSDMLKELNLIVRSSQKIK